MVNRDRGWIKRAAAAGSIKAVAYHLTVTYVLPIGLPVVAAVAGYLQRLPWLYVLVGSALTFGGVATGIVRFDEWVDRRSVREKLAFSQLRIVKNIRGEGLAIGAEFQSSADISIEFQLESINTRIGDRIPKKRSFDVTRFTIPRHGRGWFDDHMIDIGTPPRPGTIEGFIECKVKYGRVGNPQYDLMARKQVILSFNEDGLLGPCSWNDAA